MLTPLGRARPADADSLVELLAACHARIRHHAELAVTLAAPAAAAQPATAIAEAAAHGQLGEVGAIDLDQEGLAGRG